MAEAGEHGAFTPESRAARIVEQREVEQLDGGDALVASVAPSAQPDRAHAAPAERSLQGVGAEPEAGQRDRGRRGQLRGIREEADVIQPGLG